MIFDLDGVLADSTYAVNASWEAWAKRHGIEPALAIANGHGRPSIEAIRLTAPHLDAEREFREMEALEESFIGSVVPIAGAPEFVKRVCDLSIPWAVATSGTRRIAVPRLQAAGIPQPPVLITADDITHGKPDPEPYERAAGALGVNAWECAVFEDAPSGILSARRAGAAVIALSPVAMHGADAFAADFLDVRVHGSNGGAQMTIEPSHYRCECCRCHTLAQPRAACALCHWPGGEGYGLDEAQRNVREYAVMFRPSDRRFAISRHPILGPNGEYAIDRVALRQRAYMEFGSFARQHAGARVRLTTRLAMLLACIVRADALYCK